MKTINNNLNNSTLNGKNLMSKIKKFNNWINKMG